MAEWAQEVLALARRWFIMLRRERLSLVFSLVQPAIWLVFFGLGMGRAIDARAIGTADYLSFVLQGSSRSPSSATASAARCRCSSTRRTATSRS